MTPTRLLLAGLLVAALPCAAQAQSQWNEKVAAFEAANAQLDPAQKDRVVLLGSSSMEGWKYSNRISKYLPNVEARVLNRGISGDGIGLSLGPGKTGLRNRLQASVFDCNPSHVFILNGRNSLAGGASAERVAEAYRKLIQEIKAKLPDVVVCVVTCPPVNFRYAHLTEKTNAFNEKLLKLAKEEGAWYVDLHPHLVGPDGLMRPTLTADGLHMKNAGYEVLGRGIERVVRQSEAARADEVEAEAPASQPRCPTNGAADVLRGLGD